MVTKVIGLSWMFFLSQPCSSQSVQKIKGALVELNSKVRVSDADILNRNSQYKTTSDKLGLFEINVSLGDTLYVSRKNYIPKWFIVKDVRDTIIFLGHSNDLNEVKIIGENHQMIAADIEQSYKHNGIFYKGHPPTSLLSLFKGNPLTFFYELFSNNGRRARRYGNYKQTEADYFEVSSRFNNLLIKELVPIKDEEIDSFKRSYWPTVDQIRTWADYDLYSYIKKSFSTFKNEVPNSK